MKIFSTLLIVHIIAGGFCLLTGALNFIVRKRKGLHTIIGEWYHAGYFIILITSVMMAILNWSESAYLFFIAFFSYSLALFAYIAGKLRWNNWLVMHISGMAGSYIGVVTAVLVVNGTDIPYVNQIPILLWWFIPTIIGTPLIIFTTKRYRSVQSPRPQKKENRVTYLRDRF